MKGSHASAPIAADAAPLAVTIVANEVGPFGGMERQLMNLVEGLLQRGHDVTVIGRQCVLASGHPVRFYRVRGPRRPFVVAYPVFALVASWMVLRRRQGVLHATGAVILNKVDVISVHLLHRAIGQVKGLVRSSRQNRLWRTHARVASAMSRTGERWAYRPSRVRQMVAVSDGGLEELVKAFPRLANVATTIPNGVDQVGPASAGRLDGDADNRSASTHLAVFVGSEWEGKGLRYAIEALAFAPDWDLTVVGTGDRPYYEQLAEDRGVADRVSFVGWHPEIGEVYRAAHAFVLPSSYETFSLASFEAASAGLPVLVTRVQGVSGLIEDGLTGWYVNQDGADIARRLKELESPAVRTRMGEAAQRVAKGFSWDRMVDGYVAAYRRLSTSSG